MLKSQVYCDTVICSKKYIFGICSVPGTELLKIPMMRAIKVSLVMLLLTFGKPLCHLRMGAGDPCA